MIAKKLSRPVVADIINNIVTYYHLINNNSRIVDSI